MTAFAKVRQQQNKVGHCRICGDPKAAGVVGVMLYELSPKTGQKGASVVSRNRKVCESCGEKILSACMQAFEDAGA